jgi:large repetitive protein
MQKILLIIAYVLVGFLVKAQTFNGTGGTVPGTSTVQTCFNLNVTGVGVINDVSNGLSGVCINMTHPNLDELEIVLKAPDGTTVPLTVQNGGTGNNYTNTCFSATSTNPIKFGTAPFSGTYEPEGYLGAVNNGQNANGAWTLCVQDRRTGANAGTLNSWSITFSNTPAPQPPAFPACANTLPANSSCANATAVCDFNGLCGNTSGSSVQDWTGSGLNGCFGLQNNSFLKFIAAGNTASFTVWVPTNTGGSTGGIQMLFFSGTCDAGAVTTHGCYPHIFPYQSASNPVATIITANGLTPGNTYYLMFDGFNNDIATFRIAAKSGVNFLNITPDAPSICKGKSVLLTATGSDGTYSWNPNTNLNTTSGAVVTANPSATTTYTVSSTTSTGCNLTKEVTVTVNDTPFVSIQPSLSQQVCQNLATSPLNFTASAGSGTITGYQWFISTTNANSGGTLIPFATNATYTPSSSNVGTVYFYCRITNSNGCTTVTNTSQLTVYAIVATPVLQAAIQPTCAVPTGSVTVTSPVGANFEYSSNGITYQAGTTFSGLAPGTTYNITARNTTTGCISAPRSVTINAVPTEPAPVASVTTQPTCTVPTGTVTVSSPVGANYEYSAGGVYQTSVLISGLVPGPHNITVRNNTTGCISAALTITVNAIPTEPAPVASVTTQPTCAVPTGTITVSSPSGANYQYSIGGAYQSSPAFTNLTNSTAYNVTVKNNTTGCLSAPLAVAIGSIPGAPPRPTVTVVQTGCTNSTGAITVTTPIGFNYEYSIGAGYQVGPSFSNLPAGTSYQVTVRDIFTGCVSSPLDTSMDVIPVLPPPTILQPQIGYCQNAPAAALTATGTNLQWYNSVTGGVGSTVAPTPVTNATGVFKFYVSQVNGNCESTRDSIMVTISPAPALPGTGGNTNAYCQNATANILTATGSNLQWYDVFTGGSPLSGAPTPNTGTAGNVTYYVTQSINGCESGRAPITVTITPTPAAPTVLNPNIQFCHNSPAVQLTATGTNLQWYDGTGNLLPAGAPTPSTASTGSTFYFVSQTVNGCESGRTLITVTVVAVATPPVVTSPVEYCQNQTAVPLTANGVNLQWYTTLTSITPLTTAPTPVTTTVGSVKYYVSQLINTCESKRDSITVITKAASTPPTVISPLEFCQNTVAPALTATGTGLLWYAGATGGTGSSTAPVPSTANTGTTFYYVTQNSNGCESAPRTAITVTINTTSTAVTGFRYSKDSFCRNAVIPPSPLYNLGFTIGGAFVSTPAGLSINAATGDINLPGSTVGSYNIVYTFNTTGCINGNSSSTTITILPDVQTELRFSYNSPVCKDAAPVMPQTFNNFTTGGTFSSLPAGLGLNTGTGEITVSNSQPGTYTIFYNITEQGCRLAGSRSAAITIIDTTLPVTKFNYSAVDVCLTGSTTNPSITKAPGFTTGGTFTVSPAGLSVNSITGDINIGLSVAGTYVIKYSVPALLCRLAGSDSLIFNLKAYSNPVTGFSYVGPVCKGDDSAVAVLDVNITPGGLFSSSTGLEINSSTGTINLNQSVAGLYNVRYDVAQGVCNPAGFGTAGINILSQPAPPNVSSTTVCGEGDATLTAAAIGAINWYTEPSLINQVNIGATFTTFVNSNKQFYVTNKVGACESEAAIADIIVSPIPAKPNLGRDTTICSNENLVLNAGTYNSYLWQDGSTARTYSVSSSGIYKVIVSTGIGCSDSTSINITVMDDCFDIVFPNAFAPNGVNRTFGALGNLTPVSKYALRIFNRYGQEVFATANPSQRWDGTYKGQPVNIGTYTFVATYVYKNTAERVKKGTVTVIR